jgi:hypothetical protein
VLVTVDLLVLVAVAGTVGVRLGVTSKFLWMGASELSASAIRLAKVAHAPDAVSSRAVNKVRLRIHRFANLLLRGGGWTLSVVVVIKKYLLVLMQWSAVFN